MLTLLDIHIINPGTDRVMCVKMRKNCNYTDQPVLISCPKCWQHYLRNYNWWWAKLADKGAE